MSETADQPVAVRARAHMGTSKWLHRPVRLVCYDARWADGHVEFDVNIYKEVFRGRHTTDKDDIFQSMHATCPEVGTGQWVHVSYGVIDESSGPEPVPPKNHGGRPLKYRPPQNPPGM
ncbi:hypothetical protein J2M53_12615 [Arthrobacter sp. zg-ZUI100]|uniref:hypothetical protein n=1 Tax=Arthrobacter jiangjiafuii TaxID=2817475 RepID=UPI001AEDC3C1|nr:hypothetical protein [Arthrobacter jiangjiafuii]MBP3037085.1 hypothetical protein [Arthrobacter jiangjiafuii]